MSERAVADALAKLHRAGLSNLDQLTLGAIRTLADLSEDELRVLAKAQAEVTGTVAVRPLDGIGYFIF